MKAKDAVAALTNIQKQSSTVAGGSKTFAGMISVLRSSVSDADLEDAFRAAAQEFENEYSTRYDMS
ncbi:hypothetical protein U91I_02784 [alpha proteobacterium U9-1i]|nr:hypothetical protein U91I_02784 [alpha proteobacterium U9-1i]